MFVTCWIFNLETCLKHAKYEFIQMHHSKNMAIYNRPNHVTAGYRVSVKHPGCTLFIVIPNQCTNEGTVCSHLRIRGDRDVPRSAFSPFNFKQFSRKNCQIDRLTPTRKKSWIRHSLGALLIWEDFLLCKGTLICS